MALESQIQKLRSKQKDPSKDKKGKKPGNKDGQKTKGRNCKKPAWMLKAPPAADKHKPKKVDNEEYWWCSKHKSWGKHKESACEGKGINKPPPKEDQKPPPTQPAPGILKLSQALSAIAEE